MLAKFYSQLLYALVQTLQWLTTRKPQPEPPKAVYGESISAAAALPRLMDIDKLRRANDELALKYMDPSCVLGPKPKEEPKPTEEVFLGVVLPDPNSGCSCGYNLTAKEIASRIIDLSSAKRQTAWNNLRAMKDGDRIAAQVHAAWSEVKKEKDAAKPQIQIRVHGQYVDAGKTPEDVAQRIHGLSVQARGEAWTSLRGRDDYFDIDKAYTAVEKTKVESLVGKDFLNPIGNAEALRRMKKLDGFDQQLVLQWLHKYHPDAHTNMINLLHPEEEKTKPKATWTEFGFWTIDRQDHYCRLFGEGGISDLESPKLIAKFIAKLDRGKRFWAEVSLDACRLRDEGLYRKVVAELDAKALAALKLSDVQPLYKPEQPVDPEYVIPYRVVDPAINKVVAEFDVKVKDLNPSEEPIARLVRLFEENKTCQELAEYIGGHPSEVRASLLAEVHKLGGPGFYSEIVGAYDRIRAATKKDKVDVVEMLKNVADYSAIAGAIYDMDSAQDRIQAWEALYKYSREDYAHIVGIYRRRVSDDYDATKTKVHDDTMIALSPTQFVRGPAIAALQIMSTPKEKRDVIWEYLGKNPAHCSSVLNAYDKLAPFEPNEIRTSPALHIVAMREQGATSHEMAQYIFDQPLEQRSYIWTDVCNIGTHVYREVSDAYDELRDAQKARKSPAVRAVAQRLCELPEEERHKFLETLREKDPQQYKDVMTVFVDIQTQRDPWTVPTTKLPNAAYIKGLKTTVAFDTTFVPLWSQEEPIKPHSAPQAPSKAPNQDGVLYVVDCRTDQQLLLVNGEKRDLKHELKAVYKDKKTGAFKELKFFACIDLADNNDALVVSAYRANQRHEPIAFVPWGRGLSDEGLALVAEAAHAQDAASPGEVQQPGAHPTKNGFYKPAASKDLHQGWKLISEMGSKELISARKKWDQLLAAKEAKEVKERAANEQLRRKREEQHEQFLRTLRENISQKHLARKHQYEFRNHMLGVPWKPTPDEATNRKVSEVLRAASNRQFMETLAGSGSPSDDFGLKDGSKDVPKRPDAPAEAVAAAVRDSIDDFTRAKLNEGSFLRKVLPPFEVKPAADDSTGLGRMRQQALDAMKLEEDKKFLDAVNVACDKQPAADDKVAPGATFAFTFDEPWVDAATVQKMIDRSSPFTYMPFVGTPKSETNPYEQMWKAAEKADLLLLEAKIWEGLAAANEIANFMPACGVLGDVVSQGAASHLMAILAQREAVAKAAAILAAREAGTLAHTDLPWLLSDGPSLGRLTGRLGDVNPPELLRGVGIGPYPSSLSGLNVSKHQLEAFQRELKKVQQAVLNSISEKVIQPLANKHLFGCDWIVTKKDGTNIASTPSIEELVQTGKAAEASMKASEKRIAELLGQVPDQVVEKLMKAPSPTSMSCLTSAPDGSVVYDIGSLEPVVFPNKRYLFASPTGRIVDGEMELKTTLKPGECISTPLVGRPNTEYRMGGVADPDPNFALFGRKDFGGVPGAKMPDPTGLREHSLKTGKGWPTPHAIDLRAVIANDSITPVKLTADARGVEPCESLQQEFGQLIGIARKTYPEGLGARGILLQGRHLEHANVHINTTPVSWNQLVRPITAMLIHEGDRDYLADVSIPTDKKMSLKSGQLVEMRWGHGGNQYRLSGTYIRESSVILGNQTLTLSMGRIKRPKPTVAETKPKVTPQLQSYSPTLLTDHVWRTQTFQSRKLWLSPNYADEPHEMPFTSLEVHERNGKLVGSLYVDEADASMAKKSLVTGQFANLLMTTNEKGYRFPCVVMAGKPPAFTPSTGYYRQIELDFGPIAKKEEPKPEFIINKDKLVDRKLTPTFSHDNSRCQKLMDLISAYSCNLKSHVTWVDKSEKNPVVKLNCKDGDLQRVKYTAKCGAGAAAPWTEVTLQLNSNDELVAAIDAPSTRLLDELNLKETAYVSFASPGWVFFIHGKPYSVGNYMDSVRVWMKVQTPVWPGVASHAGGAVVDPSRLAKMDFSEAPKPTPTDSLSSDRWEQLEQAIAKYSPSLLNHCVRKGSNENPEAALSLGSQNKHREFHYRDSEGRSRSCPWSEMRLWLDGTGKLSVRVELLQMPADVSLKYVNAVFHMPNRKGGMDVFSVWGKAVACNTDTNGAPGSVILHVGECGKTEAIV